MKILIVALLLSISPLVMAHSDSNQIQYSEQQIQGFINQRNVDIARQHQANQEWAEADYNARRQRQLDRREDERFIGDYSKTSICQYKTAMSDAEIRACQD